MNPRVIGLTLFSMLCLCATLGANAASIRDYFDYVSPVPGARLVVQETGLIFRPAERLGADWRASIRVRGTKSGAHVGRWTRSDDGRTHIFKSSRPFAPGERVTVSFAKAAPASFEFTISPKRVEPARTIPPFADEWDRMMTSASPARSARRVQATAYTLPLDFPAIGTTHLGATAPGSVFLATFGFSPTGPRPYLVILGQDDEPDFFRKLPDFAFDFKKQPNGLLTYWLRGPGQFYALDNTYAVVDSFQSGNGYVSDLHELQILPNGHALLMIYDYQTIDMSQVVAGGDTAATVIGLVIQELDTAKNVVFQWSSWDHIPITDARHRDLTAQEVDYIHGNAIELDFDGHIMISSRHTDEITKIDRNNGDVIWRFGGNGNQFTLINDTIWFSYQHDIRRLPNGNVTLFDNGNFNTPQESRVVEYDLDEVAKTATLVWQYRNTPSTYGAFMGSGQRLANGNTLIGWGGTSPAVTEVNAAGTKLYEATLPAGTFTYRAFRFEWTGVAAAPYLWADTTASTLTLNFTKFGDTDVDHYNVFRGPSPNPTTLVATPTGNSVVIQGYTAGETMYFRVTAVSSGAVESPASNQVKVVPGFSNPGADVAPGRDARVLTLHQNVPNPFNPRTEIRFDLPRAGTVTLDVYAVDGTLVRRLVHGALPAGGHRVAWDGKNEEHDAVSTGVYFYRLTAAGNVLTRKMVVLK